MKIGVRLAIGFAAVLALLVAVAAIGLARIAALNTEVEGLVNDKFPKTVQANNMEVAINVIARHLRNAYIYEGAETQRAVDAIPEQRKVIGDAIAHLEKTILSVEGKAVLKKVVEARAEYVKDQDTFLTMLKDGKRKEIPPFMQTELRKSQADYLAAIKTLSDFQTELVAKAGKEADAMADAAERLLMILAGVAALLTALIGWLITRSITTPTRKLVEGADKMAAGDFNFKLDINNKDEIGALATSVRAMQGGVQAMIADAAMLSKAAVEGKLATRADA
ncbi:MAG: MCP four helix bundle domain-containing protein, partial [Rubrivivax sp.]|nr:MCP four helix bundle domain-containing protein [Rubrivivax sp.]